MRRFFVNESNILDSEIFITDREDIKHISKVLRMVVGEHLWISDTAEFEYECEIASLSKDEIVCKIHDKQRFAGESKIEVTLFQGIPKQGKMETIIQKCVELGVYKIIPVFTARTVVVDKDGKIQNKIDRWQKISNEAVKQCKRGIQPEVEDAIDFKNAVKLLEQNKDNNNLIIFPYENEENLTIKDVLRMPREGIERVSIIIGPEGGFSDEEAQMLKSIGAHCVSLGERILRTETAGMATLAMVMYEFEL